MKRSGPQSSGHRWGRRMGEGRPEGGPRGGGGGCSMVDDAQHVCNLNANKGVTWAILFKTTSTGNFF